VEDVAPSDLSVLIMGDTGTGKELLAQLIHERSSRQKGPFVRLNCAALPETLAESELFGHERGSFTGAERTKTGLFEAADGGTLFLDEVGELSLPLQAKLLRVLDKGEVLPVGAVRARRVAIRVVAATNRDLRGRVGSGDFRADLFYRLSGVVVRVPPLRDRGNEIPALVDFFALACASQAGKPLPQFSPEAISALCAHEWPGNVRELKHVVERVVLLARNGVVLPDDLGLDPTPHWPPLVPESTPTLTDIDEFPETPTSVTVERVPIATPLSEGSSERQRIVDALARTHGNQVRAARLLGISRRTLINRLDTYGLPRPRKTE
jgi:transcriptional regulator with GAF, ATPase, and Fis domain